MRAALYARYSTDRQREVSIDDQFKQCERFATAQGFEVVGKFHDAGISGGTADRPGYQRMLDAVRAGAVDIIVAEDLSRLWRSRAEYGPRSAEFEDAGVHFVSVVGDDTRRDGWGLVLGIKQAIAEHQRREVSYRTRRGLEGLAERGESTGGRCYGYLPGEGRIVQRIFELARGGLLPSQVAAMLNAEGLPGPRGPRWSLNAVKRILANPRYAGRLSWGLTVSQGGARDSRRTRHVPRPGGPLVRRTIPAIVDPALWDACNPVAAVG